MNLSWIDWTIMVVAVVALRLVSLSTRHHMKGVADFLSANRSAGRYLLTIASQMGGVGVVSFVAGFEAFQSAGLTLNWWLMMSIPVGVIIVLTGWVFYRFRETRALTMAQFLEMRYNRRFRIYAGLLCSISGVINFGVFPAVAARFFIYYCGLPDFFHIPGLPEVIHLPFALPLIGSTIHLAFSTFFCVMFVDLALALSFVTMGGQISVMITECVQGMFCTIAFVVVAIAVLWSFHWPQMVKALELSSTPTASMLNPFHTSTTKDFNIWYYLIGIVGTFYGYLSWQGTSGFNSSARTPHEQKMGQIIGGWRGISQGLAIMLVGLAGLVVLRLPEFATQAAIVQHGLDKISNPNIQNQMRIPMAMAHVLPIGIKGLFATIMLFISFTCHDTYMHSWGTIIVQDVIMPIRKKALSPEEHIKWLRYSIIGVAVFAFFFSWFYPPATPIYMFFAITGTIWLGGSGAVIIGGLYWKKGTAAAAFVALTTGAILGLAGLILPIFWKGLTGHDFPVNGQWLWLIGMVIAVVSYIIVSGFTNKSESGLEGSSETGTTAAVITAVITGAILSGVAAFLPRFWAQHYHHALPIQGYWLWLLGIAVTILSYFVAWSLSKESKEFNLERMLCRGKYSQACEALPQEPTKSTWLKIVGITPEFTRGDRILAVLLVAWNAINFLWFIIFSILNLKYKIFDSAWATFWHVTIIINLAMCFPTMVWFTIGGVLDIKALYRHLDTAVRDVHDNGSVVHHDDDFADRHHEATVTTKESSEDETTRV